MTQREQGFTLIEILVVISIIAALSGMVVIVFPIVLEEKRAIVCQTNLSQIGGQLTALDAGAGWKRYSGAAFVMQGVGQIKDAELGVYICPGDPGDVERPKRGSMEFIESYRKIQLPHGVTERHTSYAGPNMKDFPFSSAGRAGLESRILACDGCPGGVVHHKKGVMVLYEGGRTEALALDVIEGADLDSGLVTLGPGSEDKRLRKVIYFPNR